MTPIVSSAMQTSAVASAAADAHIVLQAGMVVDARVLQISAEGFAKIAIAGIVIDALSEAPLRAGETVRLAVSVSGDQVRLALVPPSPQSPGAPSSAAPGQAELATAVNPSVATSSSSAATSVGDPSPMPAVTAEAAARAALIQAVRGAATQQTSASQLFANLGAALGQQALPPQVQQAALALLALRVPLDASLTGGSLQKAVQASGTFLESKLAAAPAGAVPAPDMKAALLGLRQALATMVAASPSTADAAPRTALPLPAHGSAPAPSTPIAAPPAGAAANAAILAGASPASLATSPPQALPMLPGAPGSQGYQFAPQPDATLASSAAALIPAPTAAARPALASAQWPAAMTGLLAQAEASAPSAPSSIKVIVTHADPSAVTDPVPPPLRGQEPAAQPVATPSLLPHATSDDVGRTLFKDTEGALARQTLLQVASLADAGDASIRQEAAPVRLQFEIPFVTPQGTAMAHFEVAEDESGSAAAAEQDRAWRARFTLTTEPAGPVHVLVTLAGQRTSVRMWAERDLTADLLRGGTDHLSAALGRAELEPGDISVTAGPPPRSRARAAAGHFLDRAT